VLAGVPLLAAVWVLVPGLAFEVRLLAVLVGVPLLAAVGVLVPELALVVRAQP
jgi:hypothetical protein